VAGEPGLELASVGDAVDELAADGGLVFANSTETCSVTLSR